MQYLKMATLANKWSLYKIIKMLLSFSSGADFNIYEPFKIFIKNTLTADTAGNIIVLTFSLQLDLSSDP